MIISKFSKSSYSNYDPSVTVTSALKSTLGGGNVPKRASLKFLITPLS